MSFNFLIKLKLYQSLNHKVEFTTKNNHRVMIGHVNYASNGQLAVITDKEIFEDKDIRSLHIID